jgi:hypothetical protein
MWQEMSETVVINDLRRRGFVEHFIVVGRELRGVESGRTFGPQEVVIRAYHRFEGVSDPGDMAIVYAVEARDGTLGILIDAFGVYASSAVAAFLKNVAVQAEDAAAERAECPRP